MSLKESKKTMYFLLVIGVAYIILFIINKEYFSKAIITTFTIIKNILPIFIIIFILTILINYCITKKTITKHLKKDSLKSWTFAVIGGVISSGPIYMWYPLLSEAKEKGISSGLIACFLYNRAIKIPLLPLMIFYFEIKYILILLITMIIMSVFQGILINKLIKK
jgi:uncharacterized membrane protein YraQ (UPF0718 family)